MRQGADGVELDAMVCGSGEVVVCHDESLERLAGVDWAVRRTPLEALRLADVGSRLGFAPAHIPTLEEVLDVLPGHFTVNIELKCDTADDGGLARAVGRLVEARGLEERVVVSSYNPWCLFRLARAYPRLMRGVLLDPDKSFVFQDFVVAPILVSHSIHPSSDDCTWDRVRRWGARGWEVAVWTVDDPARARQLRDWGVRYCITNRPGVIVEALR